MLERVQASDSEIKEYLKKINAFEYKGYWRVFDEEYRIEALKNVMHSLMKNDWEVIVIRLLSQEIPEIPYEILISLLKTIGNIEQEIFIPDRLLIYQLCALDLFITNNEYYLEEFNTAFKRVTDICIYRKLISNFKLEDILQGIAVQKISRHRASVKYLPRYKITYNLDDRLGLLFSLKEKWTEKELETYLTDVSFLSLPQILLKHTKKVMEGNCILYTGRLK